jgi:uncharacterized membrane protein
MTSLNKHETAGTVHRIENDALFKFLSETVLERCGPIKWPIPQTFADVKKVVVVFMFFVVKVVLVSRPTTTNTKDVHEPLGFRLMSMRLISVSFGDCASGERVLP